MSEASRQCVASVNLMRMAHQAIANLIVDSRKLLEGRNNLVLPSLWNPALQPRDLKPENPSSSTGVVQSSGVC